MTKPLSRARCLAACMLLFGLSCLVLCGCSSTGDGETTTVSPGNSAATSTTTGQGAPITGEAGTTTTTGHGAATTGEAATTTSEPGLMSETDRALGDASALQHAYAVYLNGAGATDDDPRLAVFYGLRARTQALSCLSALEKEQMDVADFAMREVYRAMNQAEALATGATAQVLAEARATIATLGSPSDAPDRAAELLKGFLEALTPLLDEVTMTLSSTTTTLPSTTGR
ncbi:MAG: hypothetical protein LLG45_00610 [Actinomycetia bacterium]|nr:hypothetical protein [Actinomycetes bacterium]